MRNNKTVKRQILGVTYTFLFIASVFTGVFAATGSMASLAGNYIGTYQTPGPSGLFEIKLTNIENKWSGEIKMEGPGRKIVSKPAQKLKVEGENLTFMIELIGAEITFTGKLKDGKLSGGLEAVEDGKTVAMGSWEVTRSEK